jgi:hypothetical protein
MVVHTVGFYYHSNGNVRCDDSRQSLYPTAAIEKGKVKVCHDSVVGTAMIRPLLVVHNLHLSILAI